MYNKKSISFGFLIIFCLYQINIVISQERCSINGKEGHCIAYGQCNTLDQIVFRYGLNLPKRDVEFIQKSFQQCQFVEQNNYICCQIDDIKESTSLNPNGVEILSNTQCGFVDSNRISFGQRANLREFPWMALLRYDLPGNQFLCSGTLITQNYVLTAAHCVVGQRNKVIGIRLGEHDIDSEIDCPLRGRCSPPVEDYGIANIITHKNYDGPSNDIALIKLDRKVQFKEHIKPICLPLPDRAGPIDKSEYMIVAGWGLTEKGTQSRVLLKTSLSYRDTGACQRIFPRVRLTEKHLCAGGNDFSDSCQGDSGGPLIQLSSYKSRKRYIQYGIVSFGPPNCGKKELNPGVYTDVSAHISWITNYIDE